MKKISYSKALCEGISEEMRRDSSVVFWGLDICEYGGAMGVSQGMFKEFGPARMMDMPISEAGYTGLAVGAAATGMRPVVELQFGDWVTIASDQLVNQAANMRYMFGGKLSIPMVMRLPCGAFGSAAAQHSHMWDSWFAFVPGLKVIAPSCPYDAKGLIKSSIRDNNPVLVFEHRQCYPLLQDIQEDEYLIDIGKADIKRSGCDVSIITHSYMVNVALEAAIILESEGIDAEIVDLRSIKPMDVEAILNSVKKTNKAVCLQETWLTCSVASEVAAIIAENCFDYLDRPVIRIGAMECPTPFAPDLEKYALPDAGKIVQRVKQLIHS